MPPARQWPTSSACRAATSCSQVAVFCCMYLALLSSILPAMLGRRSIVRLLLLALLATACDTHPAATTPALPGAPAARSAAPGRTPTAAPTAAEAPSPPDTLPPRSLLASPRRPRAPTVILRPSASSPIRRSPLAARRASPGPRGVRTGACSKRCCQRARQLSR
jgi:hypothetical protein